MTEPLAIDPGACYVRHIRRAASTAPGAVQIGRAHFAAAPRADVNGPQGWVSATPERRLSDDGSLSISFPNADGPDGVPHLDRFALLTDPAYRPGEEWLELYLEPGGPENLLFVGTPVEWDVSPSGELVLKCADALALLANQRATEVDYWTGAAPREAFEHYTQAKTYVVGQRLTDTIPAGWLLHHDDDVPTDTTPYVYEELAGATWAADPAGGIAFEPEARGVRRLAAPAPDFDVDGDWEAEVRFRVTSAAGLYLVITLGSVANYFTGAAALAVLFNASGGGQAWVPPESGYVLDLVGGLAAAPVSYADTATVTLRLVARGEFIHGYYNGERIVTRRRGGEWAGGVTPLLGAVVMGPGRAVVEEMHLLDLQPLLMRGDDRGPDLLPGVPPPGGLRGDYFSEGTAKTLSDHLDESARHAAFDGFALMPDLEPAGTRLDQLLNFNSADPPTFQNAAGVGASYWSARWTGAINLNLADGDSELRLGVNTGDYARLWIAGKLVAVAEHGPALTGSLRAILGDASGWYPIRVELAHYTGTGTMTLRWGTVGLTTSASMFMPSDRLSPVGAFTQAVRYDAHRDMLGQITEAFGYQWRLEPRSLESGLFPGELTLGLRVGVDTDVIIDELEGQEVHSSGSAADAVDGMLIDAGGLANADADAPALTAEFLLQELARDHLVVHQAYESLAEVSERTMLEARGNSLLALRAAPSETIAARPTGQRNLVGLVDVAAPGPITLTGELARMRWEPGDGVRLNFPRIRAVDLTPRQLTAVAWPCTPAGIGAPVVAFRQRPRGLRAVLARALRIALTTSRSLNRR